MKGIVLAGGKGTRLYPLTQAISKQLMPIYDKPMIYYPLSTLIAMGIHDVLIISSPEDLPLFERLLGDGSAWGCSFSYAEQAQPNGLAEAFLIAEDFINNSPVALILGDNLFYGHQIKPYALGGENQKGAGIFAYRVKDPQRYGVVSVDEKNNVIALHEKPTQPASSFAVPGLYFYDNTVVDKAKKLMPSARGELEITDINQAYLNENSLQVSFLSSGAVWLDTGTISSLTEASQYVETIQSRQGILVGSPELAALDSGAISQQTAMQLAEKINTSEYGKALLSILKK